MTTDNSGALDHALDLLCADRSPRQDLPLLTPHETSMFLFAQLLRGTLAPPPSPQFVAWLLDTLFPSADVRDRIRRLSSAEVTPE